MKLETILMMAMGVSGIADTNVLTLEIDTNARPRMRWELSAEAKRLAASPFYRAEVDQFTGAERYGVMFLLQTNCPAVVFSLTSVRGDEPLNILAVHVFAESRVCWPDLREVDTVWLMVDGVEYRIARWPGGEEPHHAGYAVDAVLCQVPAEVLRAVCSAQAVQIKIRGARWDVRHDLDAVQMRRLAIWRRVFLDGQPARRVGP